MKTTGKRVAALVALLLFSVFLNAQTANREARTFELRRGVIVDGARGALYLPKPDGAIEAVDLSAGRVLWTYNDAALPLAIDGTLLVAQVEEKRPGRLPVSIVDLTTGRKVVDSVIPLPNDVRAMVTDDFERSFRATAEREGDAFLVSWTFKETTVQGVWRAPEDPLPTRVISGAARIQIPTGRVISAPVVAPRIRTNAVAERVKAIHMLDRTPLQVGNVLALTQGGRGEKLTLKRWDVRTSAALPDRELSKKAITVLPSAEETYVLASERVGEGGPQDPEYRWSIFSLESGEKAGELRRDVSAAPFFVWNDSVIYESRPYSYRVGEVMVDEPLKIRALRLDQGEQRWDRPVRHLEYRGPVPPAR